MQARNKAFRVVPFLLALACFLLPFVEVSCAGYKTSLTGFQVATGWEMEKADLSGMRTKKERVAGDALALLALVCTGVGVLFSCGNHAGGVFLAALGGAGGFVLLVWFKLRTDHEVVRQAAAVTLTYPPGFSLACLFLLAGAGLCVYQLATGAAGLEA
jgi:hypothetical protein